MTKEQENRRDEVKKQSWVEAGEWATYPKFVTSHDVAEFMFDKGYNSGFSEGERSGIIKVIEYVRLHEWMNDGDESMFIKEHFADVLKGEK